MTDDVPPPPNPDASGAPGHRSASNIWLVIAVAVLLLAGLGIWGWRSMNPSSAQVWQAASRAIDQRDLSALLRAQQRIRNDPEYYPQSRLIRGVIFLMSDDYSAAVEELSEAGKEQELTSRAGTLIGETLCRAGRLREAQQVLHQVIAKEPDNLSAHRWLSIAYYDTGADMAAVEELKHVARLEVSDFRPHRLMGLIHKDNEQFPLAVTDYGEALKRNLPPDIEGEVVVELAECLIKQLKYEECLKLLEKRPPSAPIWSLRAECETALGRSEAATQAIQAALAINPTHLSALLQLGTAQLEKQDFAAAAKTLEIAVQEHPADFTAHNKLSVAYSRLNRTKEAEFQVAEMNRLRKLREHFTELHENANKAPHDAKIRFDLGQAARQLGMNDHARMWYKACLSLDPRYERARQALSELPQPTESSRIP